MMLANRGTRIVLVVVFSSLVCPSLRGDDDLHKALVASDAPYRAAFRASGGKTVILRDRDVQSIRWRYAAVRERQAIEEVRDRAVPGRRAQRGELEPSRSAFLFDEDLSGACFTSSPRTGSPLDDRSSHSIDQSKPDDAEHAYYPLVLLLTMGRGYARHIDSVESVEPAFAASGEPVIRVAATGRCASIRQGRWDLVIDQGRSNLVREASFTVAGESSPRIRVANNGEVRDGDCLVAESGRFTLMPGPAEAVYDLAVESASLTEDRRLFSSIRNLIVDAPPRSFVEDRRRDPPRNYRVDEKGRVVGESAEASEP